MAERLAREGPQLAPGGGNLDPARALVRSVLERSAHLADLPPEQQISLARNMVRLTQTALDLADEEAAAATAAPAPPSEPRAVAFQDFDPQANRQLSQIAQDTIEGIAFPRFVTELVNGVFRGLIDANAQQLQAYVDLMSGVSASSADSAGATGADAARSWILQRFGDSYTLGAQTDIWGNASDGGTTLALRDGADAPSSEEIRAALEIEGDSVPAGDDPEDSLVPAVRAYLSRKRQQVIATLLTLGINRLVIDHGKIKAGMNFQIDARSAAEENRANRFDFQHSSTVGAKAAFGPWGVNASMTNSIGIVRTKQAHEREDLSQQVNMNADVELHFHSDYLPLNTIAAGNTVDRIKAVSLNPNATPAPAGSRPSRPAPSSARTAADGVVSTSTLPAGGAAANRPAQGGQPAPAANRPAPANRPATANRPAPAGNRPAPSNTARPPAPANTASGATGAGPAGSGGAAAGNPGGSP